MKFAVWRQRDKQPRFFTGAYDDRATVCTPLTTGRPEQARTYDALAVAQVIADFFNALEGIKAGAPQRHWQVIELPEAWI